MTLFKTNKVYSWFSPPLRLKLTTLRGIVQAFPYLVPGIYMLMYLKTSQNIDLCRIRREYMSPLCC